MTVSFNLSQKWFLLLFLYDQGRHHLSPHLLQILTSTILNYFINCGDRSLLQFSSKRESPLVPLSFPLLQYITIVLWRREAPSLFILEGGYLIVHIFYFRVVRPFYFYSLIYFPFSEFPFHSLLLSCYPSLSHDLSIPQIPLPYNFHPLIKLYFRFYQTFNLYSFPL